MSYELIVRPAARRDLTRLAPAQAARLARALERLGRDFEQVGHIALAGDLRGAFRLRVGDYRILYTADHNARRCFVLMIRHRSEVYR